MKSKKQIAELNARILAIGERLKARDAIIDEGPSVEEFFDELMIDDIVEQIATGLGAEVKA